MGLAMGTLGMTTDPTVSCVSIDRASLVGPVIGFLVKQQSAGGHMSPYLLSCFTANIIRSLLFLVEALLLKEMS
jgi:hypothetical protein